MKNKTSGATRSKKPALVLLALLQKSPWQQLISPPMAARICGLIITEHISFEAQPFTILFSPPIVTDRMKIMLVCEFEVWVRLLHYRSVSSEKNIWNRKCLSCRPATCFWDAVILIALTVQSCSALKSIAVKAFFAIRQGPAGLCKKK